MKNLLTLIVLALAANSVFAYSTYGTIKDSHEVFVIQERVNVKYMDLYYSIKFPVNTGYVNLFLMDAYDDYRYTWPCDPNEKTNWNMTFYADHPTAKCHMDPSYTTVTCEGYEYIMEYMDKDQFFGLARCEYPGLTDVYYHLSDKDYPTTSGSTGVSGPSLSFLLLSIASFTALMRNL